MIVCIAEKPSVAKEIADILGAKTRRDGFYEGNGYRVTWTFGHLCTLKEPNDYTPMWQRWSLSSLPMIPPRFGIKLIDDKGIEKQFGIIEKIMHELGPNYNIQLVTGDRLLQISALHSGIVRTTAKEFEAEVAHVGKEINEFAAKLAEKKMSGKPNIIQKN